RRARTADRDARTRSDDPRHPRARLVAEARSSGRCVLLPRVVRNRAVDEWQAHRGEVSDRDPHFANAIREALEGRGACDPSPLRACLRTPGARASRMRNRAERARGFHASGASAGESTGGPAVARGYVARITGDSPSGPTVSRRYFARRTF